MRPPRPLVAKGERHRVRAVPRSKLVDGRMQTGPSTISFEDYIRGHGTPASPFQRAQPHRWGVHRGAGLPGRNKPRPA